MSANIDFKNYTDSDYEALCSFLIALNENDDSHINWNWASKEIHDKNRDKKATPVSDIR